jgi:hypothetical protein
MSLVTIAMSLNKIPLNNDDEYGLTSFDLRIIFPTTQKDGIHNTSFSS